MITMRKRADSRLDAPLTTTASYFDIFFMHMSNDFVHHPGAAPMSSAEARDPVASMFIRIQCLSASLQYIQSLMLAVVRTIGGSGFGGGPQSKIRRGAFVMMPQIRNREGRFGWTRAQKRVCIKSQNLDFFRLIFLLCSTFQPKQVEPFFRNLYE